MKPTNNTTFIPTPDVTFEHVMEGVEMASLIGDHKTSAHGTLIRLAPGVKLPLHHYTQPLAGVVLQGKVAHPIPGNAASQSILESGAFFSFAAGEPHETNNEGDGHALFFIFQDQPWRFEMD